METKRVNLCNSHAISLLFLHTGFRWERYTLDNTPILGWVTACDGAAVTVSPRTTNTVTVTLCDHVQPDDRCPEPATDLFQKTSA